jgi:NADH-quinone oxidoreductase subunit N
MVLAGLGFKIALVPFHMWTPDVYEGAPTPITAFLAVGSKAAGFVAFIRVFFHVFSTFQPIFMPLLILLTVLTLLIGNLIAIAQTQLKRFFAYSSIAHAGYILLGVIAYSKLGLSAILFYLLLYLFANIGAFAGVTAMVMNTGHDRISDLSGLWKRSPFVSIIFLISLLSLAGIPPTAGFIGKFYLFTEAIHQGYVWLAAFSLGMSLVAIYYYLMVIRTVLSGNSPEKKPLAVPFSLRLVMIFSAGMTILIGVWPGPFTDMALRIAQSFLG